MKVKRVSALETNIDVEWIQTEKGLKFTALENVQENKGFLFSKLN